MLKSKHSINTLIVLLILLVLKRKLQLIQSVTHGQILV